MFFSVYPLDCRLTFTVAQKTSWQEPASLAAVNTNLSSPHLLGVKSQRCLHTSMITQSCRYMGPSVYYAVAVIHALHFAMLVLSQYTYLLMGACISEWGNSVCVQLLIIIPKCWLYVWSKLLLFEFLFMPHCLWIIKLCVVLISPTWGFVSLTHVTHSLMCPIIFLSSEGIPKLDQMIPQ